MVDFGYMYEVLRLILSTCQIEEWEFDSVPMDACSLKLVEDEVPPEISRVAFKMFSKSMKEGGLPCITLLSFLVLNSYA
jgi:hypothetical protein